MSAELESKQLYVVQECFHEDVEYIFRTREQAEEYVAQFNSDTNYKFRILEAKMYKE